jgi:hypothetical protein
VRNAAAVGVAGLLLVIVGTIEAGESARQLSEIAGRPRLQPAGAGLTALGLALSGLIYLALGGWAGTDRAAVRLGALTGVVAGLAGGSVRALLIAGPVGDIVDRYAAVPEWFVPAVLIVFVALAAVVSAAGGAVLAFAGVRIRRRRDERVDSRAK